MGIRVLLFSLVLIAGISTPGIALERNLPYPRIDKIEEISPNNTTQALCASYLKRPKFNRDQRITEESFPLDRLQAFGNSQLSGPALGWDEIDFPMIGRQFALKLRTNDDSARVYKFQLVGPLSPTDWSHVVIRDTTNKLTFLTPVELLKKKFEQPHLVIGNDFASDVSLWSEVQIIDRHWATETGFGPEIDKQVTALENEISAQIEASSRSQSAWQIKRQLRLLSLDQELSSDPKNTSFLVPAKHRLQADFYPLWETIRDLRALYRRLGEIEESGSNHDEELAQLNLEKEALEVKLGRFIEEHNSVFYHVYREGEAAPSSHYKENFSRLLAEFEASFDVTIPTLEEINFFYRQSPIPTLSRLQDRLQQEKTENKKGLLARFGLGFSSEYVPNISSKPPWVQHLYSRLNQEVIDRASIMVYIDGYQRLRDASNLLRASLREVPREVVVQPDGTILGYEYPANPPAKKSDDDDSKDDKDKDGPEFEVGYGSEEGPDPYNEDDPPKDDDDPDKVNRPVRRRPVIPQLNVDRRDAYKELFRLVNEYATEGDEALTFLYRISEEQTAVWIREQIQIAQRDQALMELFPGFNDAVEKAKVSAAIQGPLSIRNLPAGRSLLARSAGMAAGGVGIVGVWKLSQWGIETLGASEVWIDFLSRIPGLGG